MPTMHELFDGSSEVCTYDNPATMHREAWQDGKLVASISAAQMMTKGFDGHPRMFFGLNVGRDFVPGQIVGDPDAMPSNARFSGGGLPPSAASDSSTAT